MSTIEEDRERLQQMAPTSLKAEVAAMIFKRRVLDATGVEDRRPSVYKDLRKVFRLPEHEPTDREIEQMTQLALEAVEQAGDCEALGGDGFHVFGKDLKVYLMDPPGHTISPWISVGSPKIYRKGGRSRLPFQAWRLESPNIKLDLLGMTPEGIGWYTTQLDPASEQEFAGRSIDIRRE